MENFKCSSCGKIHKSQKGNFLASNSSLFAENNGYIGICRTCVEKHYLQLIDQYSGSVELAIKHCCAMFDWFYHEDIVAATKTAGNSSSRISLYPSRMNMVQFKAKGNSFADTIANEQKALFEKLEQAAVENLEGSRVEGLEEAVDPETIKFFGSGHSDQDYAFLQREYDDWTSRHECETKAQEELFKAISLAQLTMQKAQIGGDIKEIETSAKTFQSLLDSLNITPKKKSGSVLNDTETFGTLIKKLENERPVSDPDPAWADVDKIRHYLETWFLGHLCNLVDVKSDVEAQYLDELAKFSVSSPDREELYGSGETSILDKFSKSKPAGGEPDE